MNCSAGQCPFAIQDCANCTHNVNREVSLSEGEENSLSEMWELMERNALLPHELSLISEFFKDSHIQCIYVDVHFYTSENIEALREIMPKYFIINTSIIEVDCDNLNKNSKFVSPWVAFGNYPLFNPSIVFTLKRI